MNIGDRVKVIDQDITGLIVALHGNKATIEDEDSEYESPDNNLEYRLSELEEIKNKTYKFSFVQHFECEWEAESEEEAEEFCREHYDLYDNWQVDEVEAV
jgi:predicted HAD superfamily phosphohydrolase